MPVTITYLQMHAPPSGPPLAVPDEVLLLRCQHPSVSWYRFLYDLVGSPWRWTDRKKLSDADLAEIVQDPRVEIQVLHHRGSPGGYFEIDRRREGEAQLAYFGLAPECVGRGLGRFLLDAALRRAWEGAPRRVWVHTCTLDHPAALPLYRKAGFVPYREEVVEGG